MGVRERGWHRCFIPTYFCQEVTATIAETGVEVAAYEDSPLNAAPESVAVIAGSGDLVLLVNYFGLRDVRAYDSVRACGADILEDHTHDPWSSWARSSKAEYCLASLRKTLTVRQCGRPRDCRFRSRDV